MAVIGIDLGTTNSLAAIWKDGQATIIPNPNGNNLTPSVVSIDDQNVVMVGDAAKERIITNPTYTASCFKRTMGQDFFYKLNTKIFTSVELSALVLQNIKRYAEQYLGEEVTEAVISVPAYFNQNQRKATKDAAQIAGLKVERLVNEPTAAALCYGIQNRDDMNTILVFDLGGGTFDVSLLELFDGVVDVKAVSGDNHLGGEDFTQTIVAWFLSINNLDTQNLSTQDISKIFKQSEIAKRVVTSNQENAVAQISVEIDGKQYDSVLTLDTFNSITSELLQRLLAPVKKVLQDSGNTRSDIDMVIMMGGSTKMKPVVDFAKTLFGPEKVVLNYNPDETVALGAGILAAMKENNVELKETVLTDICPFSLGVEVRSDSPLGDQTEFSPIIERNSPIPISIVKQYCATHPGQNQVEINVYQGESLDLKNDVFLGKLEAPIPTVKDHPEILNIRFTYDINGLLEVEESDSNNQKHTLLLNNTNVQLSELEMKQAQKNMAALKILPWEQEENRLIIERGKRLYTESTGQDRQNIQQALTDFETVLQNQNPNEIKKMASAVKKFFDSLEREW